MHVQPVSASAHSVAVTPAVCDYVVEGQQLLVEFTDGTSKLYRWRGADLGAQPRNLRWLTKAQMHEEIERVDNYVAMARAGHIPKTQAHCLIENLWARKA